MRFFILAVGLGCAGCIGWDDVPRASVRPVAPEALADSWYSEVEDAVEVWRAALETAPVACKDPFRVTLDDPDAHDVKLIPREEWTHEGWSGFTYPDLPGERGYIGVKYSSDYDYRQLVLVHELGHALGLDHSADPTSVMFPTNLAVIPSRSDVVSVANMIVCSR